MGRFATNDVQEFPEKRRGDKFSTEDFPIDQSTNEGAFDHNIGEVEALATGDGGEDVVAGGWQGTDDATSTAPSDLAGTELPKSSQSPEFSGLHVEAYNGEVSELSEKDAEAMEIADNS
jgi:hypothetical protein